ncbi:MAG: hypothetical protein QGH73_19710, partial [Rhodospirillales bacterium]|nr:hypothetical protein [Rhodospirillales bacterium]
MAMRFANRAKGNKSPFEAFGGSPEIAGRAYDWDSILARAQSLPPNKSWRFSEDAMARFEDTERDFIARQLTDTQYLSRIPREYLTHICAPENIWVIPGRMTAMLRGWAPRSVICFMIYHGFAEYVVKLAPLLSASRRFAGRGA